MSKRVLTVEPLEARYVLDAMGVIAGATESLIESIPPADDLAAELDRSVIVPIVSAVDATGGDRTFRMEAQHFVSVLRLEAATPPLKCLSLDCGGKDQDSLPRTDLPTPDTEIDGTADPEESQFNSERIPRGVIRLALSRDSTELKYRLKVPRLPGVTSAKVYLGDAKFGGPAVATLFELSDPSANGISVKGTLDNEQIQAIEELGFDGTMESLVQAMREGKVFVAVHSKDLPHQVLKGGLRPIHQRPFHNPINRMDVTADKVVTPRDALMILEDMNLHGARVVGLQPETVEFESPYVDVTGDNFVSPRDALVLLDYLGKFSSGKFDLIINETVSRTTEELSAVFELSNSELPNYDFQTAFSSSFQNRQEFESVVDLIADHVQLEFSRQLSQWSGHDLEEVPVVELDFDRLYSDLADQPVWSIFELDQASSDEMD